MQNLSGINPRAEGTRVTETVAYLLVAMSLAVAAFSAILMVRNRQVTDSLFYVTAVVEVALVAALVGGCIALASTSKDVDGVLFVAYLVTLVLVPPAAIVWAIAEKSRWGTGVLVVAMLSTAVLCVRILGIWQGRYV